MRAKDLYLCVFFNLLIIVRYQHEETNHINASLEHRFHELEVQYSDATTLLHLQGTLIIDLQVYTPSNRLYFSPNWELIHRTCLLVLVGL